MIAADPGLQSKNTSPLSSGATAVSSLVESVHAMSHRKLGMLTEETSDYFGVPGMRFVKKELLGSGSFGSVYRCSLEREDVSGREDEEDDDCAPDMQEYAVKIIDATRLAMIVGYPVELVVPRLQREVEIHKMLGHHDSIVRLHYNFFAPSSNKFYLVTECLKGGDLFQAILRLGRAFSEKQARIIFIQLAKAIAFIHGQGIAHRDIKLENILLQSTSSLRIKLCDYGQAKVIFGDTFSNTAQTLTTTPAYTAPEVKQAVSHDESYNAFKADTYGLGVVLYALLMNAFPVKDHQDWEREKALAKLSAEARDIILKLLTADPVKRLSISEVLDHPWLTGRRSTRRGDVDGKSEASDELSLDGVSQASDNIMKQEVQGLVSLQHVIVALQRERGTCCWSLGSREGMAQYAWRVKYSDERMDEVQAALGDLATRSRHAAEWSEMLMTLQNLRQPLAVVRNRAVELAERREQGRLADSDFSASFNLQFSTYCAFVTDVTTKIHDLHRIMIGSPNQTLFEIHHRLLQMTAEQLGRERAVLSAHFERPKVLSRMSVMVHVIEMIGARKMLLGCSASRGDLSVVASGQGLFPALRLDHSPLDQHELHRLEHAEERAIRGCHEVTELPAVAETFHLLTELIDKIHQKLMLAIVEWFGKTS
eukprot:TRINITY_DN34058_c0_g1_i1.p1 TRINITY_DN34058_c0_g1~~TRINITY_DN34058_c0_g1_i1.p1  ORF type:complete len:652 (-),score=122.22 TRINITY_DN34058_c0_g1_i1:106-2061(-)